MKLSAFKKGLRLRLLILKTNTWFTFQQEMAYAGNNWASLASTTFYTISMLIFLNILYSNVREVAGYSYQEMLFMFLMAQVTYYFNWVFSLKNIFNFIVDVNKGNLDMVLIKPVPALFFITTRRIDLLGLLRECVPPTIAIILSIKWDQLVFRPENVIVGSIIMIMGLWVLHVISLLAALPVFWLGESESIVDMVLQMSAGNGVLIPLEGFSRKMQITLSSVIPILLTTAFSTSAILNKSNPWALLVWSTGMAVLAAGLRKKMWDIAIRNYTSASS